MSNADSTDDASTDTGGSRDDVVYRAAAILAGEDNPGGTADTITRRRGAAGTVLAALEHRLAARGWTVTLRERLPSAADALAVLFTAAAFAVFLVTDAVTVRSAAAGGVAGVVIGVTAAVAQYSTSRTDSERDVARAATSLLTVACGVAVVGAGAVAPRTIAAGLLTTLAIFTGVGVTGQLTRTLGSGAVKSLTVTAISNVVVVGVSGAGAWAAYAGLTGGAIGAPGQVTSVAGVVTAPRSPAPVASFALLLCVATAMTARTLSALPWDVLLPPVGRAQRRARLAALYSRLKIVAAVFGAVAVVAAIIQVAGGSAAIRTVVPAAVSVWTLIGVVAGVPSLRAAALGVTVFGAATIVVVWVVEGSADETVPWLRRKAAPATAGLLIAVAGWGGAGTLLVPGAAAVGAPPAVLRTLADLEAVVGSAAVVHGAALAVFAVAAVAGVTVLVFVGFGFISAAHAAAGYIAVGIAGTALVAGMYNAGAITVIGGVALAVAAWDAAVTGDTVRRTVGAAVGTTTRETLHVVSVTAVAGAITVVLIAAYRLTRGITLPGSPRVAVGVVTAILGGFLLVTLLRG